MKKIVLLSTLMACFAFQPIAFAKTYKLSHNTSNTTTWQKGAIKFAELVSEETDGKVKIRVFPNSVLTGGNQMKQAEMNGRGALDFMITSAINVTPLIPEMATFSLPYLFSDYEDVDRALQSSGVEAISKIAEEKGIIILAWGENGFREVTNNQRPITSPDDLKGMTMRVVGPMYIDIFNALGANPQQVQWAETISALQQGVVDGQENPIGSIIVPQRLYEIQKHITLWHYTYDPIFISISKKLWSSFDTDTQNKVAKAAKEAMAYQVRVSRDQTEKGIEKLKQEGMTVTQLTPEQIEQFKQKTKPVYEAWKAKVGADLVAQFESK